MTTVRRIGLLRRMLVAVMAVICLSVVAVYLGYRHFRYHPRVWVQEVPRKSLMSMDQVHHTATRDGRTEWVLDARGARLEDGGAVVQLTQVAVRFFPREGGTVDLSAAEGRLHTAANDIELQGLVVVETDAYRLETDRLRYDHAASRLLMEAPVSIRSRDSTLEAASMTFFLDQRRAEFTGAVKGVFGGPMLW